MANVSVADIIYPQDVVVLIASLIAISAGLCLGYLSNLCAGGIKTFIISY